MNRKYQVCMNWVNWGMAVCYFKTRQAVGPIKEGVTGAVRV